MRRFAETHGPVAYSPSENSRSREDHQAVPVSGFVSGFAWLRGHEGEIEKAHVEIPWIRQRTVAP
jgi:hypothetical protein